MSLWVALVFSALWGFSIACSLACVKGGQLSSLLYWTMFGEKQTDYLRKSGYFFSCRNLPCSHALGERVWLLELSVWERSTFSDFNKSLCSSSFIGCMPVALCLPRKWKILEYVLCKTTSLRFRRALNMVQGDTFFPCYPIIHWGIVWLTERRWNILSQWPV